MPMNLLQALEEKEKDDILRREDWDPDVKIKETELFTFTHVGRDAGEPVVFTSVDLSSDKWIIIKAEPKILTGQEWLNDTLINQEDPLLVTNYLECFEAGEENGQLKEWKNHQPLREAVENLLDANKWVSPYDVLRNVGILDDTLKNLKLLKAE